MTQRRTPIGQGPSRRPSASSTRSRSSGATNTPRVQPARSSTRNRARPASARRVGSGPSTTKRTVATRPRALTGRAGVVIVVLIALALAYTYPLRVYLAQETQIAKLEADQAAQQQAIAQKSQELQKWQDPEYVRAQAREKLFYFRPGDIPLLVIPDRPGAAGGSGKQTPTAPADRWYETLWSSVRAADAQSPNK